MGRLRLCCCAILLLSGAGIVQLYLGKVSLPAVVALIVGMVALAAVVPRAAHDRPARMRLLAACIAYTIAAAAAVVLALSAGSGDRLLLALPAMGGLITLWAWLTRKRRRLSGVSSYHPD